MKTNWFLSYLSFTKQKGIKNFQMSIRFFSFKNSVYIQKLKKKKNECFLRNESSETNKQIETNIALHEFVPVAALKK